ncbi:YrbL family protein [Vibrio zhugei]|uniref:YrbL family protein n=1 Tax=Vibrio zhugei TaxID=2479546 RepID=A0ABV7C617_9VIBR|nr:YrbL family protein [Vibrio zhugei]
MYVTLSEKLYLAEGSCRTVYQHPSADNLCIKVNHNPDKDRNITEIVFFKNHRKQPLDFISHYEGTIDTNLGKGVVTEIVKDHDGSVSKSLEDYIRDGVLSIEQALAYVMDLQKQVLTYGVLLHDDGIQNILMRKEVDGSLTPVLIDGFGPRDMSLKAITRMLLRPLAKHKSKQVVKGMMKRTTMMEG